MRIYRKIGVGQLYSVFPKICFWAPKTLFFWLFLGKRGCFGEKSYVFGKIRVVFGRITKGVQSEEKGFQRALHKGGIS